VPFYEYRCDKGHTFEVRQRMTDDPVTECEKCGRPVQRVFHPVAVHFKGSGFYNTDYGKKGSKAAEKNSSESSSDSSSKSEKKSDTKPETKASSAD
jgi:putative FmdB family regulatory protein